MATQLQKFGGTISLVGSQIDKLVQDTLTSPIAEDSISQKRPFKMVATTLPYHITLFTKDERSKFSRDQEERVKSLLADTTYLFSCGIGRHKTVYWVVIIWAAGQAIRKQFGLGPKHFHITLSTEDIHENVDKGMSSLILGHLEKIEFEEEFLDHTSFTLYLFGNYVEAQQYAKRLILYSSRSDKGFLRLGDACFSGKLYKPSMLAFACAYQRTTREKAKTYCMKRLLECSRHTEWGLIFQEHELDQLADFSDICMFLLQPWCEELRKRISEQEFTPELMLAPRDALYTLLASTTVTINNTSTNSIRDKFYKLPRFFRWLIPFHLALCSTPRNEEDITTFASPAVGIRHVVTLTEETPLAERWFQNKQCENTFMPIPNFYPPSVEQMDLIIHLLDDPRKVPMLIHCGGGKGRAGTVAACYLAAFGFRKPPYNYNHNTNKNYGHSENGLEQLDHPAMTAQQAIASIRALRPGSLETTQQERFVASWCTAIWKRRSVYPSFPSEPPSSSLKIEYERSGAVPGPGFSIDKADLLVLVGLPGSGKSFFARSLLARNPHGWVYISQDEHHSRAGGRASCEAQISRKPPPGKRVILDRCNTSAEDRSGWVALAAGVWCMSPVCVFFDYEREVCEARAQRRVGHPTLPPGGRVRRAVEQMASALVRPDVRGENGKGAGERFKALLRITSFEAANEAVRLLSGTSTGILKFPRTPHLIDVGAAADDDLHVEDNTSFFANNIPDAQVVITEKIDGANMGFSISSSDPSLPILVQNRSHYIALPSSATTTMTHEHWQFKKLSSWISEHESTLRRILHRDTHFPDRYVLYGEWMYATHSIAYTRLPSYFVAYDLYDRSLGRFISTESLHGLLRPQDDHYHDQGNTEEPLIPVVPIVYKGSVMPSKSELLDMIQKKSRFYDGRVEGVYVKVERGDAVMRRAKVVRGDFIAGNEHWTKGEGRANGLEPELEMGASRI